MTLGKAASSQGEQICFKQMWLLRSSGVTGHARDPSQLFRSRSSLCLGNKEEDSFPRVLQAHPRPRGFPVPIAAGAAAAISRQPGAGAQLPSTRPWSCGGTRKRAADPEPSGWAFTWENPFFFLFPLPPPHPSPAPFLFFFNMTTLQSRGKQMERSGEEQSSSKGPLRGAGQEQGMRGGEQCEKCNIRWVLESNSSQC